MSNCRKHRAGAQRSRDGVGDRHGRDPHHFILSEEEIEQ